MFKPLPMKDPKVVPLEHSAADYEGKIRGDSTKKLAALDKKLKAEFEQKDVRAKNMTAWGIFALVAVVLGFYSWATNTGGFQ